jgi:hypothetical protein
MTLNYTTNRIGAIVLVGVLGACGDDGGAGGAGGEGGECVVDTTYDPVIDPASFVATVDNPWFPLIPGTVFTYQVPGTTQTVVTTVTSETKVILGVTCTVVHDVESEDGEVVEDTYDWYAQDTKGNVWYFGEDTRELEGGEVVSTEGSWEAGKDGAKPGIVMQGMPQVGQVYQQEYYACEAEDKGEVLALDASVTVPHGSFTGCLKTHDFTPLEPDVNEEKYYCPGVGHVLAVDVTTGEREELVSIATP